MNIRHFFVLQVCFFVIAFLSLAEKTGFLAVSNISIFYVTLTKIFDRYQSKFLFVLRPNVLSNFNFSVTPKFARGRKLTLNHGLFRDTALDKFRMFCDVFKTVHNFFNVRLRDETPFEMYEKNF